LCLLVLHTLLVGWVCILLLLLLLLLLLILPGTLLLVNCHERLLPAIITLLLLLLLLCEAPHECHLPLLCLWGVITDMLQAYNQGAALVGGERHKHHQQ
jgi:hypothetical protein